MFARIFHLRRRRAATKDSAAARGAKWAAAPLILGLGLTLLLRRRKIASDAPVRIEPDDIQSGDAVPLGPESLNETELPSSVSGAAPEKSASVDESVFEPIEQVKPKEETPGLVEFDIPTLISPGKPWDQERAAPATLNDLETGPRAHPASQSARRGRRRVLAAAVIFLLAAAVVYGTVGAVRSRENKRSPLLFANAGSATAVAPPAEGPMGGSSPNESGTIPETDTTRLTPPAERASAPASESSPALTTPAAVKQQRLHRRSNQSRQPQGAHRKTKNRVPWKVSF